MSTVYISTNIKHLRKVNKITQKELADMIGKTYASVGAYELEKNIPPLEIIIQIAQVFKVSVEDFIFKNMALEQYDIVEEEPAFYDGIKDKLITLLEDKVSYLEEKIARYERFIIDQTEAKIEGYEERIKRELPEVARELGL